MKYAVTITYADGSILKATVSSRVYEQLKTRPYSSEDKWHVSNWLAKRAAGYPMRDLPWPPIPENGSIPYSDSEGAPWRSRLGWHTGRYAP